MMVVPVMPVVPVVAVVNCQAQWIWELEISLFSWLL